MSEKIKNNIINEEELNMAENEAKSSVNEYVHKFGNPFTYENKTYEQLTFDWDNLTGEDSLAIESEMSALGKPLVAPEFSGEYLIRMASRACTEPIGSDAFCAMSLRDYNKIRNKARSFLLRSGR